MMSVWNTTTNWICWYPRRSAALFYSQVIVWSFKISSLVIQNFIKWCYPFHVEGQEPYLRHYYDQLSLKNCQLSEKCLEVSSLREGCSYTSQVILTSLLLSARWEALFISLPTTEFLCCLLLSPFSVAHSQMWWCVYIQWSSTSCEWTWLG